MQKRIFVVLFLFWAVVLAGPAAFGQATAAAKPQAANAGQENPEKILRQMTDFVGKLPAFSFKVESVLGVQPKVQNDAKDAQAKGPQNNTQTTKMTVRFARPNRAAMVVDEGMMGLTVVTDGKQLVQFLPMTRRYVVKEAPADFAGITDIGVPTPITMLGGSDVLIPTSAEAFYKRLMAGVTKSEYLGQEKVGDALCHHCRFTQEEFDWDVWIEVGQRPVVHKVQPDLTKQLAEAGPQFEGMKFSYVVTLSDWNVAPKFTDADFTFVPPAGAQKSDALFDVPEEPPHPLLGQAAPEFTTTNLAGKPVDLKSYLGKNVVLLDFWATWCGPCVHAMPEVDGVATKYKDKGLVFYAVNVGEDAETIKKFLAEAKLEPPVALDGDNKISELYKVEGIPQTLLIGKDGKVQVVHVGYSPQLAKALTSEIEDLLVGKDLASEALKKAEESRKKNAANAKEAAAAQPGEQEKPAEN